MYIPVLYCTILYCTVNVLNIINYEHPVHIVQTNQSVIRILYIN